MALPRSGGFLNFENSIMTRSVFNWEKSLYGKHLKHWPKLSQERQN